MTKPTPRVEVAFAADPLDATYAKGVCTGSANSYFTTPDAAALDITGDIDITARVALTDWTPSVDNTVVSKWGSLQSSYMLVISPAGQIVLFHTADGSTALYQGSDAQTWVNGATYWVRATLDVNDGAGNRVYRFYRASDSEVEPLSWTLLNTVTVAGTTSIYSGTYQMEVGTHLAGTWPLIGDVHRVIVRSGIGGTVVADFDPYDALTPTSSTWGSSRVAGQVWTRGAGASLSVAPVWTDITAYVRDLPVSIGRGKQSEIPTFASSSLTLTLSNRDRRFDPEYTSSPLYPDVEPRKRIRVRGTYDSTTHTLFTGYVESWPQSYPGSNYDATVELTAYDALALLNDTELEDAAYLYARDTVGSLSMALRQVSNGSWLDAVNGYTFRRRRGNMATSDSLGIGPADAVDFDGNTYWSWGPASGAGVPAVVGTAVTYACWFRCDTLPGDKMTLFGTTVNRGSTYDQVVLEVYVNSDGRLLYTMWNGTNDYTIYSTGKYADGVPHFLTITHTGSTAVIYVDGRDITNYDSGPISTAYPSYGVNLFGRLPRSSAAASYLDGAVSDFYLWSKALSAAEVSTMAALAAGLLAESTSARAGRLLTTAGVPSGLRATTDVGRGEVSAIDTYGRSALSELQVVADSESGSATLFVDTRGRVALHDRYWWQSSPRGSQVQATFSDDLADLNYTDVAADRNLREVQNRINVTGSAGTTYTASDSASVAAYGTRPNQVSTILSTQGQVESLATGLVAMRKDPVTRLEAITVRPAFQPSAWPSVLRLELGDRIVFELMPARGVATTSQLVRTLIVERLDWVFTQDDWALQITGSPVPTMTIFTLDQSLLDGTDVLGF